MNLKEKLQALGIPSAVATLFIETGDESYATMALEEFSRRTESLSKSIQNLIQEYNFSLAEITAVLIFLTAQFNRRAFVNLEEEMPLEAIINMLPELYLDAVRTIVHGVGDEPIIVTSADEH